MKGHIYKISNKINNLIYIGQTIQTLNKRFGDHLRDTSNCIYLKNAINKHGKDQFKIECIETVEAETKQKLCKILNDLEMKYIKEYNSLYPNGYNLTSGGDSAIFSKTSIQKRVQKLKKSIICNETGQVWSSIKECAESFGTKSESIHRVLRGVRKHFRNVSFSYFNSTPITFSKETRDKLSKISKKQVKHNNKKSLTKEQINRMKIPIICNETGIKYDSLTEAARDLNAHVSGISRVLSKKIKSYRGLTFSYLNQS